MEKLKIFLKRQIAFSFTAEEIRKKAIEKWGYDISNIKPSYFPDWKDSILILERGARVKPNFHQCTGFVAEHELLLTNVHGLVVLELLDWEYNFLQPNSWVMGIDKMDHLHFERKSGHIAPCLLKDEAGRYRYYQFPWNTHTLGGCEYLLAYEKAVV